MAALVLHLPAWGDGARLQVADIGFYDSQYYIGIEFKSSHGAIEYGFSLCSSDTGQCIQISECKYSEENLLSEIDSISNEGVKSDFKWIFLRSDHSSVELSPFFSEFKDLLMRTGPGCLVKDLELLKGQLSKSIDSLG